MAELSIGGVWPYTISLDSIDLTYLSKYVSSTKTGKMQLWTKKCLDGESEYCQVQIVGQDGNGDCHSEPTETYECHICNVHVPIMFSQEHDRSERHETMKKIFEQVFERVSKQMGIGVIRNDTDLDNRVYFCVPCSKVIKIENKNKHNTSNYHMKSKKVTNIVHEFYKIFKEHNDSEDDDDAYDETDERSDEENDSEPDYVESYKANNNYDTNNKNLESFCNGTLILDSGDESDDQTPMTINPMVIQRPGNIAANPVPQNDNKNDTFEKYLIEMIKKYNLNVNLPMVDREYIMIESANRERVKVSREHFHSYRQLENSVYCQLCKMWISQDTRPHEITENHARNIFKQLNENFARTINLVSSHCVPCNKIVSTDSDQHALNHNHKLILKDVHTPKTFCEDCDVYIDTHNFPTHTSSRKHLNVLITKNSMQSNDNDDSFYCKICNVTLPKYSLNFHINSKRHIELKTNNSKEPDNKSNDSSETSNDSNDSTVISDKSDDSTETSDKTNGSLGIEYCWTCEVKVPLGGMKIHVDGKPHKKIIKKLGLENENENNTKEYNVHENSAHSSSSASIQADSLASTSTAASCSKSIDHDDDSVKAYSDLVEFTDDTKATLRCRVCLVNIVFVKRNIVEHLVGNDHGEENMEVYSTLSLFSGDAKAKVKCEICNVNMAFIKRCIVEHMEGRNHAANANKVEANKTKMDEYLKLLSFKDDAKTMVRCEICDVDVPYVQRNIIEHMEGRNHEENANRERANKVKLEEYMKQLSFIDVAKTRVRCEICDVDVPYVQRNIIEHMEGRNHEANVTRDKLNKTKMEEYLKLLSFTDDTKTRVKCKICDVQIGYIERCIIEHMEGRNHAANANKVEANKIKMDEYMKLLSYTDDAKTKVRCEICDVDVPYVQRNVIEHMEGRNHEENANRDKLNKTKMEEYSKLLSFTDDTKTKIKCKICDVQVGYMDRCIIEHMEGRNHAANANKVEANKIKMDEYMKLLSYTDDAKTKVKCKICDVDVPYVQRNVIEHMEGRNHEENTNREKANKEKMEKYFELLLYTDDTKTKVKCMICDVEVPYVQRNVFEHMDGRNHKKTEEEVLHFHLLDETSSGYTCSCCEIHITDYFEHVHSRTHTMTFLEKFDIDNDDMRKYVYEDDINDPVARCYREQYKNLLKYNNIFKINDTQYYCGMCQIKIGRINEIEHVLGERHERRIKELNALL